MWTGRLLASCAVVLCGVFALARPAGACSCAGIPDARAALAGADVVFEGRAQEVEPARIELIEGYDGALRFTFEVERYYKEQLGPSVQVVTIDQGTACGRSYEMGSSYLVYARYQANGLLRDSLCSRTQPIGAAVADLELLGPGVEPDPAIEPRDVVAVGALGEGGCALGRGASFGAPLALSALALLALARRRRVLKQR